MMVIDGVSGGISNASANLYIDFFVRLAKRSDSVSKSVFGGGFATRRRNVYGIPRLARR